MKKYLILILTIIEISTGDLCGQTSADIYIIGTSITSPEYFTGFDRSNQRIKPLYIPPHILFYIRSLEKDYEICLTHYNYNPKELAKIRPEPSGDTMIIVDKPITFLNDINAIDVTQFIASKTKDQAVDWAWSNYRKKVWIIDRNDFHKSSPSLSSPDRIKLIEARIDTIFLPDPNEESFE